MKLGGQSEGFSLVELMVVLTIIGILSQLVVPSMSLLLIKSRNVEAKGGLRGVELAINSYFANYHQYPNTGTNPLNMNYTCLPANPETIGIGFSVAGAVRHYYYGLSSCYPAKQPSLQTDGWMWAAEAVSTDLCATYVHWDSIDSSFATWNTPAYFYDALRLNANGFFCSPFDLATGRWPNNPGCTSYTDSSCVQPRFDHPWQCEEGFAVHGIAPNPSKSALTPASSLLIDPFPVIQFDTP